MYLKQNFFFLMKRISRRKYSSFLWSQCNKYGAKIYGSCPVILEEKTELKPTAEVDREKYENPQGLDDIIVC